MGSPSSPLARTGLRRASIEATFVWCLPDGLPHRAQPPQIPYPLDLQLLAHAWHGIALLNWEDTPHGTHVGLPALLPPNIRSLHGSAFSLVQAPAQLRTLMRQQSWKWPQWPTSAPSGSTNPVSPNALRSIFLIDWPIIDESLSQVQVTNLASATLSALPVPSSARRTIGIPMASMRRAFLYATSCHPMCDITLFDAHQSGNTDTLSGFLSDSYKPIRF